MGIEEVLVELLFTKRRTRRRQTTRGGTIRFNEIEVFLNRRKTYTIRICLLVL